MIRPALLTASVLVLTVGIQAVGSSSEPGPASSEVVQGPPAATPLAPVAMAHGGDPLCIHYDVVPVSKFYDHYQDGLGHHYHGWQPPAGPPFYVACPLQPGN